MSAPWAGQFVAPCRRIPLSDPAPPASFAERLRAGHRSAPSGVVTFLATENVAAAEGWDDPDSVDLRSQRLDDLVCEVVEARGGTVVTSSAYGDRTLSSFVQPSSAAAAAWALHRAIDSEPWPGGVCPKLRIGLHTGESAVRDGSYSATMLNRVDRVRSVAPPGRTVVSSATAELLESRLPDGVRLVELAVAEATRDRPVEVVFGLVGPDDLEPFPTEPESANASSGASRNAVEQLEACLREQQTASVLVGHLRRLAAGRAGPGSAPSLAELDGLASVLAAEAARIAVDIARLQALGP